jgi:hypothetical protein
MTVKLQKYLSFSRLPEFLHKFTNFPLFSSQKPALTLSLQHPHGCSPTPTSPLTPSPPFEYFGAPGVNSFIDSPEIL